jgi:peptidoglycan/LPS O-acetylase OafA/YrhL
MKPPRNHAIDVARLVAAFGVIAIHCGPTTPAAERIVDFFSNFCVPFFLLSSLFLFWAEVQHTGDAGAALGRRVPRLLVPYAVWTAIYLAARAAKLLLRQQPLDSLFAPEPLLRAIATGGGAVQLYFLPLLLLALGMAWALSRFLPATGVGRRWMLAVGVGGGGMLLLLGSDVVASLPAHKALTRLAVLYLDWFGWLIAPVAVAAWLAGRSRETSPNPVLGRWLLATALALDLLIVARAGFYAWRLHSLVLAVLLLLACIHLGGPRPAGPRLTAVTGTTFGVFLMHHLLLEGLELADVTAGTNLIRPYTPFTLFIVALATLAACVSASLLLKRSPRLSFLLLGS